MLPLKSNRGPALVSTRVFEHFRGLNPCFSRPNPPRHGSRAPEKHAGTGEIPANWPEQTAKLARAPQKGQDQTLLSLFSCPRTHHTAIYAIFPRGRSGLTFPSFPLISVINTREVNPSWLNSDRVGYVAGV
jgi:hypothetical protein